MYVDIKETIWTRYKIYDKDEDEVLKALNDSLLPWEFSDNCPSENLFDTSEVMEVEENGGNSTIEFYNDNGEIIWENGK